MTLQIVRASSDRVRFGDGVAFGEATRPQLERVQARFQWFAKQRVDTVPLDEADLRELIRAMDEAS